MSTKEMKYGKNVENNIYFIKQLDNLGIDRKYTGYYLLVEIMQVLINEEKSIKSFSRELYPQIARKYHKTDCTIERNIRSLIDKCWNKDMMIKLNVFYLEDFKPTCRTFVYLIKDYILKQIN